VVLAAQFPFELLLFLAIEIGGFDHGVDVVVEIGIDQLQLGPPVSGKKSTLFDRSTRGLSEPP
jgi:hypothetical protein